MEVTETRTDAEIKRLIEEIDLGPIKVKLMDTNEGPGWSLEKVQETEVAYKRFLYLTHKYPERPIVPKHEVDEFWHQHILDTRKYAADCQSVFGSFLHHFPYFGMRGEEDRENLEKCFAVTKELYESEFGDSRDLLARAHCHSSWCSGDFTGDELEVVNDSTVFPIDINSELRPVFEGPATSALISNQAGGSR